MLENALFVYTYGYIVELTAMTSPTNKMCTVVTAPMQVCTQAPNVSNTTYKHQT